MNDPIHVHDHLSIADRRARNRMALASLFTGFVMLALKIGAYFATGSKAIMADAIESGVHQAATLFMFWCFRFMQQPADDDHTYGHGRVEGLSVGFEGGTICLAGCAILWEAIHGLWLGSQPDDLGVGAVLITAAAAINLVLGSALVRIGRRTRSAILEADGHHVLADVWTSAGVLAAVLSIGLLPAGPWRAWIDGGVALAIAVMILITATRLMRQAFSTLLDEVDRSLLQQVVDAVAEIRDPQWLDIHNLRCRTSGDQVFVDFHLTVPAEWTILQGHMASEAVEQAVLRKLRRPGSVFVHLDFPHDDDGRPIAPEVHGVIPLTIEGAVRFKAEPAIPAGKGGAPAPAPH